jgi:hypothetical protein
MMSTSIIAMRADQVAAVAAPYCSSSASIRTS